MTRLGSPLTDARSAYLLVGLIAALVYANALPNQFAYDDQHIVVTNTAIQSVETLPGALVVPYWPNAYGAEMGLWRPVTTALLGVQYIAGGGAPLVFHAVNVLTHALASLLVLALLLAIMSSGAALAGALVFAVHPVHVEAVANVIGLSEIVSTVAVLGACLVHVRTAGASRWRDSLAIAALYAVGFGAKESAVTLPGLIFLLDAAREDITFRNVADYVRRRWPVYLALVLVAASMLAVRFAILGSVASPLAPVGADLLTQIPRIWTLGTVWTHYVRLWVFPLDLSADYSPGVIPISIGWGMENGLGVGLALMILMASLVAWRRPHLLRGRDTAKAAAFGVLWFLIAISPTSNTVFLSGVLLAERTLYLPSVGLAAGTGWLVMRLSRERPRGAWVALVVMLGLSAVRTWTRNPTWYDNPTMLTAMVRDYPQAGRSQWVLGDVLLGRGRASEALLSYRAAINLLGTHYQLMTEISKQLIDEQRYRAAERLLEIAWEETPRFPLAPGLLALTRAEHGDAVATEQWARRSLALEEVDPTRHHLLAWALAAQGRFPEAAESRRRAEEQGQAYFWQQYMYLAYVRRAAGDTVGAYAAVDTAGARAFTDVGRAAVDSVRMTEFGMESMRGAGPGSSPVGSR